MARLRPEYVFAPLLAVFGVIFALGMPPCQTPDEPSHFFRAYRISEGRWRVHKGADWAGGSVPLSIVRVEEHFRELPFRPDLQTKWEKFASLVSLPLEPHERMFCALPGSAYYSVVPYVPQAIGMAVARWTGFGPLGIFYAGRLANLAVAVVLVFWAIRLTPVYPLAFGMIALIPITVHEFGSQNPDCSTIAVGLLLVAVVFRLALAGPGPASRPLIAGFAALAIWLTLCKFPYAALTLLYLAVPFARLGGFRNYLRFGAAMFVTVLLLSFLLTRLKDNLPDRLSSNPNVSITKQVEEIRARPLRYAKVVLATVAEHGGDYLSNLGLLGWLDTRVNPLAMQLYVIFLVVVTLGDRRGGLCPSFRLKLLGLAAGALCATVILTSCYVCGCVPRAPLIVGPQVRYFIPLLPLLLLPLYTPLLRVQADPRVLLSLAGAAACSMLLVAVAGFARRYYFSWHIQLRLSPASLAVGLALFVAVAYWARWRYVPLRGVQSEQPSITLETWRITVDAGDKPSRSARHSVPEMASTES
jgi:uncharacterized membrane protein